MKVSHIIYKVNDLEKGVLHFREQGFHVEYGSKRNPHNALIYFSEGPYIELLEKVHLPFFIKSILRIIGKGKVVERLEGWGNTSEGLVELCLENYGTDFKEEEQVLKKYNQKYFITKSKRFDPADRMLKWRMLFPHELKLPFLMTYFNEDPKPKNFIHPNGIKKIKSISYGSINELIPLIRKLCDDEVLDLFVGEGVKDLQYEKE